MFDVFEKFAADEKKETCGAVIPLGDGVSLTIARADNSKFLKLLQETADKVAEEGLALSAEKAEELDRQSMLEVLARTVLLDWKGVAYKGKPIKYTLENAAMLLSHRDFRKLVMTHANDFTNYKAELEDADIKN